MRVGLITTSYPRVADDPAGSFVAGHVDWLLRAGHSVEVLCAGAGPRRGSHQVWQPGVELVEVPAPPGLFYDGGAPERLDASAVRGGLDAARFSRALWLAARRRARSWDAAFAHWLVPCAAALAMAAPPRLPWVAIAHSGDVHLLRRLGLTTPLALALERRAAGLAFVSADVRERFSGGVWPLRLRRRLQARAQVTPMGVDVARLRAAAAGDLDLDEIDAGAERAPLVLFLGRLVAVKGVDVLIDAICQLPAALGPVRVVIAGAGPLREALEARAARAPAPVSVELIGEVRGRARDALLARADLLVMPSVAVAGGRREGMPVTVLEAMAAGVPAIVSRVGGLAELPGAIVRHVEPGDPAALARELTRCLRDPGARQRQAATAAGWVERYDWGLVGARLWSLLPATE